MQVADGAGNGSIIRLCVCMCVMSRKWKNTCTCCARPGNTDWALSVKFTLAGGHNIVADPCLGGAIEESKRWRGSP